LENLPVKLKQMRKRLWTLFVSLLSEEIDLTMVRFGAAVKALIAASVVTCATGLEIEIDSGRQLFVKVGSVSEMKRKIQFVF
jgi:hypothetical protein